MKPLFLASCFTLLALNLNVAKAAMIELAFDRITSNNSENVAGQLSTKVWDQAQASSDFNESIANDEVLFTFTNNVGTASNIGEVYFDDGTILSQTRIINNMGGFTKFDDGGNNGVNPGNLPGSNLVNPEFVATADFGADTSPGKQDNGINTSSDILGIVIKLLPGLSYSNVVNALSDGDLRIGLHVRSIGNAGGSDSFVNKAYATPTAAIPLPAAAWLFGPALLGLTGLVARNKA